METLIRELSEQDGPWDQMFAVLGPAGASKTAIVRAALARARESGVQVGYVDLRQAREIWEPDAFYGWLTRTIASTLNGNAAIRGQRRPRVPVSPRVLWCDLMERLIARTKTRLLIALDHFESISERCAHDLTSDLREIQDKSGDNPLWTKFRCILAGTVSVYQLRRRSASPNLQFQIRCLPDWCVSDAEGEIRTRLAALGRTIDDDAVTAVAAATMGEPVFLDILSYYLPAERVSLPDVHSAVDLAAQDGSRFAELSWPATLYALDGQFRQRADDLMDGRAATWCDASADIDSYQLAGAIVVGDPARRQARFRNDLVQHALAALHGNGAGQARELSRVSCWLLQQRCKEATAVVDLLDGLAIAWQQLTRVSGTAVLLLRDPVEKTRGFLIDQSSIAVEQKPPSVVSQLGVRVDRLQVDVQRTGDGWVVDTLLTNHLVAGIRIATGDEFVPTVAMRDILRLWAVFLEPVVANVERLGLDALGNAALKGKLPHGGKRVFVSSTYLDLHEHRRAVMEQIIRHDMLFRGMEHFGADPERPGVRILEEVREADVYVGIFGVRYGSVDAASGLSMTELEFKEAELRGMPMLLYVFRSDATVRREHIESDPESSRKLNALLDHIKKTKYVYEFGTPDDLAHQVYIDLSKYA